MAEFMREHLFELAVGDTGFIDREIDEIVAAKCAAPLAVLDEQIFAGEAAVFVGKIDDDAAADRGAVERLPASGPRHPIEIGKQGSDPARRRCE